MTKSEDLDEIELARPRKYSYLQPHEVATIDQMRADGVKGRDIARALGRTEAFISRVGTGHSHNSPDRRITRGKALRLSSRTLIALTREVNITENFLGKRVSAEKLAKKYGGFDPETFRARVLSKILALIDRFWKLVDRSGGAKACHPWLGALSQQVGKPRESWPGRFAQSNRVNILPHRYAYQLLRGEIPAGKVLIHTAPRAREIGEKEKFDPILPLIEIIRDERTPADLKAECCRYLLPFFHPKLSDFEVVHEGLPAAQVSTTVNILNLMADPAIRQAIQDVQIRSAELHRAKLFPVIDQVKE